MLAHKVDGENPAGYSDLLLTAWKLERRAEARDPLPLNTAVTSGSNTIHSQTPGNVFIFCKLKGNHTFTTWVATIWNAEGEAHSGVKQEGEGETEPSADEEVEASGRVEGTDQPMEYIICFAKAVELYPQKNQSLQTFQKTPFLNPDPLTQWSGSKDIAWVRIDGEKCWAALDKGSTINAVTPFFIKAWSLDVSPLSNLVNGTMGINGFGGLFSWLLGYDILGVQVEGVRGYDKDQVTLVIPHSTAFGSWVPGTLGTLTIKS